MHRKLLQGLSSVGDDAREAIDDAFVNLDPDQTELLSQWEAQFGLQDVQITEATRRERLLAAWQHTGGQSPGYIQERLQAYGFDVYVHEAFEPRSDGRSGGSINGDETAVYRDPRDYLTGGASYSSVDGGEGAYDGNGMQDGALSGSGGYPLVNIITTPQDNNVADGMASMQDGGVVSADGSTYTAYVDKEYTVPDDSQYFPHFLYIGGEVFPALAEVSADRQREFEDLCLRICPTEKWLGILVNYV